MSTTATDLHDPTVRAIVVVAGWLVYGLTLLPVVVAWPRSWQAGALVAVGLTVAATARRDRLLSDDADGTENPGLVVSVAATTAVVLFFEYVLGAVAPGLRDAVGHAVVVAGAGAVAGLLLVGAVSLVRD